MAVGAPRVRVIYEAAKACGGAGDGDGRLAHVCRSDGLRVSLRLRRTCVCRMRRLHSTHRIRHLHAAVASSALYATRVSTRWTRVENPRSRTASAPDTRRASLSSLSSGGVQTLSRFAQ